MKKTFRFSQDSLVKVWMVNSFKVEAETEEEALEMVKRFKNEEISTSEMSHLVTDTEFISESIEPLIPQENEGKRTIELYDANKHLLGTNGPETEDNCIKRKKELIDGITEKVDNDHVLDASKMKNGRIAYINGTFDTINKDWVPCLVKDINGRVGVDFFEKQDKIPLKSQIGLKSFHPYSLDFISIDTLADILQAMVKP